MAAENPRSTASIAGHPIHAMLAPFPIVCFIGTLITDLVYWKTAIIMWSNFSSWLLLAGLVMAVFAALFGVIDFFGDSRIRALRSSWIHGVGNATAVILSIFNAFVHSHDAYTSVVPTGLILSVIVVLILLVTGWLGGEMVFNDGVGVRPEERR